jgi:hypothetical protein
MIRPVRLAVALIALALLSQGCGPGAAPPGQPIRFSHDVHAAKHKIDCRFCHAQATRSASAGIPSVEKCMACHRSIAADNPEVRKIALAAKEAKPVAWNRVAELPGHVYFPHRKMVNAGIPCLFCHPGLDRAEAAVQKQPLTMGWCMKCHRQRGVSIDCLTCHK